MKDFNERKYLQVGALKHLYLKIFPNTNPLVPV